ncbi:MAG: adaptor protein MecA [Lachnospiraceae bacterium]
MKIERLNENQIRCTLTREDPADRKLKLSELAYGTEKAKSLFREMMQQAAYECGFEANDIPLMIEAIPMSADSIILIITKVEDPEELDTRFANFHRVMHRTTTVISWVHFLL